MSRVEQCVQRIGLVLATEGSQGGGCLNVKG